MAIKQESRGDQSPNIVSKKGNVKINYSNSPEKEKRNNKAAWIGFWAAIIVALIGGIFVLIGN